ncbi:MAG: hypothetical protein V1690_03425 [Candidatus Moraniibacteriota bacterium]
MPRKKPTKAARAPKAAPAATAAAPKKSSKLLSCFLVIVILILLGLIYSMASFFLPSVTVPVVSFFGRMGVSELPDIPGLPSLKAPADYRISQTDDYPISMEVTVPYFNLASRGNFNIVSQGLVVSLADPGDPDWKTEWKVYQDIVYDADLEGGVRMEERQGAKYFLVDIPGKGIKAKSSGQSVLTFSLAGVPEGGTFPIKIETSDGSSQMQAPTQETRFINRDPEEGINMDVRGTADYNSADTYQDQTFSATGKLIKDNGQVGAVISVGSTDMPAAYKDAALQARDIARQYGVPGGLQNLYDDNGRINNDSGIASMDTPVEKPLRIFLNSEK